MNFYNDIDIDRVHRLAIRALLRWSELYGLNRWTWFSFEFRLFGISCWTMFLANLTVFFGIMNCLITSATELVRMYMSFFSSRSYVGFTWIGFGRSRKISWSNPWNSIISRFPCRSGAMKWKSTQIQKNKINLNIFRGN